MKLQRAHRPSVKNAVKILPLTGYGWLVKFRSMNMKAKCFSTIWKTFSLGFAFNCGFSWLEFSILTSLAKARSNHARKLCSNSSILHVELNWLNGKWTLPRRRFSSVMMWENTIGFGLIKHETKSSITQSYWSQWTRSQVENILNYNKSLMCSISKFSQKHLLIKYSSAR